MPGITNDFGQIELIDTLWNVNADCCQPGGLPMTELIDTLWNVNEITYDQLARTPEN